MERDIEFQRLSAESPTKSIDESLAPITEKQVWEQTRKDYVTSMVKAQSIPRNILNRGKRIVQYRRQYNTIHKDDVGNAIISGKPVPPKVLADYPDLAAKYAPKKKFRLAQKE